MNKETGRNKSVGKKVANVLFWGLLLLLVFSPDAKSWLLRRLVSVGLFNTEIKAAAPAGASVPGSSFTFRSADGRMMSTADLRGKVVFINFWASWCPPCRAEMPSLNALYTEFKGDGRLVFLFVSEDEDPAKAQQYLKENGFAVPLVTQAANVPDELYSGTLPTTIVLNKEGAVVFRHTGLAGYNTPRFKKQLRALL